MKFKTTNHEFLTHLKQPLTTYGQVIEKIVKHSINPMDHVTCNSGGQMAEIIKK